LQTADPLLIEWRAIELVRPVGLNEEIRVQRIGAPSGEFEGSVLHAEDLNPVLDTIAIGIAGIENVRAAWLRVFQVTRPKFSFQAVADTIVIIVPKDIVYI
jgi:hypothetical protein